MKDQELFQELAGYLIDASPSQYNVINMVVVVYKNFGMLRTMFWHGDEFNTASCYSCSSKITRIAEICRDLHAFYNSDGTGDWNVMHFKVFAEEDRFEASFDKELGFESEEVLLSDYIQRTI